MASSIIIHYLVIISIASFISSISARYRQPSLQRLLYDISGSNDVKETSRDNYQYVIPQYSEPVSQTYIMGTDNRNTEDNAPSRINNRMVGWQELEENNVVCEIVVTKGVFWEEGYEFFPPEYFNRTCIQRADADHFRTESNSVSKPEVCRHHDNEFGCQTLLDKINVLKMSKTNNKHQCWERLQQEVAVGCKCNIRFTYNQYT